MAGEITVWDTSVLIPLILPQSKSGAIYARLDNAGWIVAATPAILKEVRAKLTTKSSLKKWLGLSNDDIEQFVEDLLPALVRIYPGVVTAAGAVPSDPDDDVVVAAALESGAKYIISEDRHLIALGNYGGITTLNRDLFRDELDRLGVPR
jgi:putative PIN family toxin of toxin-antitoxin system